MHVALIEQLLNIFIRANRFLEINSVIIDFLGNTFICVGIFMYKTYLGQR